MFCGKCGKKNKEGNLFCTGCGEPLDTEEESSQNNSEGNGAAELMKLICKAFEIVDMKVINDFLEESDLSITGREMFKYDLLEYCLYLCTPVGDVTSSAARFINHFLDFDLDRSGLLKLYFKLQDNVDSFSSTIPLLFMMFKQIDKNANTEICRIFRELYKNVGDWFLIYNGREGESVELLNYISLLERYMDT